MNPTATIDWTIELDRNRAWMLRILRSRVGDAHAADDLIQDVAMAVLRQSSRPSDPEKVAPWLYRLTVRQAINFHRRSGRRRVQLLARGFDEPLASEPSPLDGLMALEQRNEIQLALMKLKPKDREILTLKYCEHWTYERIAQHTGAKLKTIEYRLMRARKMLRRHIVNGFAVEQVGQMANAQAK